MLAIYDGREAFYQWDSGQKLLVTHEGVCEVHYKQPGEETALAVNTYDQDGQTVADVPNILLQEAGKLTAYIYVCVGDACTVKKAIFTIKPRPRPADYVYTETEVKTYSALEKRLDEIEANGLQGPPGPQGIGISHVEQRVTSLVPGGQNTIFVILTNGMPAGSFKVCNGARGKDGATPVKGVDYWTESDQTAIKDELAGQIITQEAGQSESIVMSQKAVTDLVASAMGSHGGGLTVDEDGNATIGGTLAVDEDGNAVI